MISASFRLANISRWPVSEDFSFSPPEDGQKWGYSSAAGNERALALVSYRALGILNEKIVSDQTPAQPVGNALMGAVMLNRKMQIVPMRQGSERE